ncbi:tRNA 2-selenouridine(34) synthase MnmH [Sulfuriroseicoccus oceanibius]|uniref:tRNA 2-selenouridine(34) synthase MnmH n=1 Tax=Sulfuriroseicoccus oceanibius TaxID=2707525 RepID=A0A6B3LGS2_9BACT|nr:tRNA 2-selenouridine(34) synthase MnmH [Sulfuriroseicoccus oceanibius]QQL44388.1 tRNA 2-selenouridine(34) synthase MnmH [Sulfuriroseicoccus oceanibius]
MTPHKRIDASDISHLSPAADEIIDVRSPAEFAEDHVPGAINLPVLSDAERKEVGTIYKQVSPFEAKRTGAALITANISRHLSAHFADKPRDYKPVVYCWRGGQRSQSLVTILQAIGWYVRIVDGGYKAYRATVMEANKSIPPTLRFVVVGGLTGSGKTKLLHTMERAGAQVLDLEGLAHHRGSLLGDYPDGQPHQKSFESRIAAALQSFSPDHPVFVESESSRIGKIHVPDGLWEQLKASPRIELEASVDTRTSITMDEYRDFLDDPEPLITKLSYLRRIRGNDMVDQWITAARNSDWIPLVRSLLVDHYDPSYSHAQKTNYRDPVARVSLADHTAPAFESAARQMIALGEEHVAK